ncbi:hypothetical protein KIH86_23140 [Paenibacillus sp. HN-1]|uniref:hypothetical protein n=1 Tax=Paenibacillus TaxID=44249 RepID=UPI001CA82531|nr:MULTISPECIES: hypothetical protein [Paenibacillus]MBY9081052.1 hypothetical protein [Paenibacillus sp. CGMCC 1.18879]MBY9087089.1 hypothetical protein [Paenibacillus sinensis]
MKTIEDFESEARFIAKNAKHNLHLVRQQAHLMDPKKLDRNIRWLEMMIELHKSDLDTLKEQKKKARLAGRTGLRTRLKYLVASILRDDSRKRKEGAT